MADLTQEMLTTLRRQSARSSTAFASLKHETLGALLDAAEREAAAKGVVPMDEFYDPEIASGVRSLSPRTEQEQGDG